MCGIAALINPSIKGTEEMEQMLMKIKHRGDTAPTQINFGNSILGSVRLRIVDIPNGTQPFFNETNTVGVVFNGEIYNYKTLKAELLQNGHSFKTESDTEVLVHLYEEYGIDFITKLEGMFAFFIYDNNHEKFFGVRDCFGVKPFFYCKKDETLYVSSEMKSFISLDVDLFEELKPGHYITNEGVFEYYNLPNYEWCDDTQDNIKRNVIELVEEAVYKRVQTDLPIATFLSGGIDSTIVHLLATKYHKNVTALIVGEESGEDVIYAKRLCHDLKLKYHHINIDKKDLFNDIEDLIYSIETFEPNPIRGSLLSMKLSKLANDLGFKIVLCGEGSDEIFGGYGDFLDLKNEQEFQGKIISLLNDLHKTQLLRVDKTGMKYGIEVREPFLDRNLVEYALNIHPSLKVCNISADKITTKYILREAFKNILPEYIYLRDKMTLMEGAGIGGVEKNKGLVYDFAEKEISDYEFSEIKRINSKYNIQSKEEAFGFKIFSKFYLRAEFAIKRVSNAQIEIKEAINEY